jgi:hypothetical protein
MDAIAMILLKDVSKLPLTSTPEITCLPYYLTRGSAWGEDMAMMIS